jgi:8-amino-7-oxononanoate synthase
MPPASVATVLAALAVIEEEPELRERLWKNTRRMQEGLKSLGYDIGDSETPVIPVMIGDLNTLAIQWRALFDAGVFTNPVIPPAVPHSSCRLRISMMATHTDKQIDYVLDLFAQGVKRQAAM